MTLSSGDKILIFRDAFGQPVAFPYIAPTSGDKILIGREAMGRPVAGKIIPPVNGDPVFMGREALGRLVAAKAADAFVCYDPLADWDCDPGDFSFDMTCEVVISGVLDCSTDELLSCNGTHTISFTMSGDPTDWVDNVLQTGHYPTLCAGYEFRLVFDASSDFWGVAVIDATSGDYVFGSDYDGYCLRQYLGFCETGGVENDLDCPGSGCGSDTGYDGTLSMRILSITDNNNRCLCKHGDGGVKVDSGSSGDSLEYEVQGGDTTNIVIYACATNAEAETAPDPADVYLTVTGDSGFSESDYEYVTGSTSQLETLTIALSGGFSGEIGIYVYEYAKY